LVSSQAVGFLDANTGATTHPQQRGIAVAAVAAAIAAAIAAVAVADHVVCAPPVACRCSTRVLRVSAVTLDEKSYWMCPVGINQ